MVEITEEITSIIGQPKKLLIFLHGYIDSAPAIAEKRLAPLIDDLENVAIHIPQAPMICEIHECKKQWYSIHRFDPNDDRKTVESMEECVKIYDGMGEGLREANEYLSPYIDYCLNKYGLKNEDLFLCGFSQGASLAIYGALMREEKIAGCVSIGGIITPHTYLREHYKSSPDTLLIHSDNDNLVRYEAMDFTKKELESIGCEVTAYVTKNGRHRVTEKAIKIIRKFVKYRM